MFERSRALADCLLVVCFCVGLVLGTLFYSAWALLTDSDQRN